MSQLFLGQDISKLILEWVVRPTRGRGFWLSYLPPFIGSASLEWGLQQIGPPMEVLNHRYSDEYYLTSLF